MTTYFRELLSIAVIASMTFLFTSCYHSEDPGPLQEVERSYAVADFDRVDLGHAFQVTIQQGNFFEVRVRGDRRNIDDLVVDTQGSTLVIGFDEHGNRRHETYIEIVMPMLVSANFSGAVNARVSDFHQSNDDFNLILSGASRCQLDVDAKVINLLLSGASVLTVRGEASEVIADVSGASVLKAFNFPAALVDINASGASKCEVVATEILQAKATGASAIRYRGDAAVSADASDSSTIAKD